MIQLRPMDPTFPIERQVGIDVGPVVLINVFNLDKADEAAMLHAWTSDARFMHRQPGFISAQLYRGPGTSGVLTNVAVWESASALWDAFTGAARLTA